MRFDQAIQRLAPGASWRDVHRPSWDAWVGELRASHKFELTEPALAAVDGLPERDRVQQVVAMCRAGVFRLPYDDCLLSSQSYRPDGTLRPMFTHVVRLVVPRVGDRPVHRVRFFAENRRGEVKALAADVILDLEGDVEQYRVYSTMPAWCRPPPEKADAMMAWLSEGGEGHSYVENAAALTSAAVILLSTRGVVREEVRAPASSRRLALLRGVQPRFDHVVVRLHPGVASLHGLTRTVGGRALPRIHWRRGHRRTLPGGRSTWVQAHLVGHSELGEVTHDYSVTS